MNKQQFIKEEFIPLLRSLDADAMPLFGKMNVQQMIEHMAYSFRQASRLIPLAPVNNEEVTLKMFTFMMSDRPFKDNTPNPYLPEVPAAPVFVTIETALADLQSAIDVFFATFENKPELRILNPFFGNMNYDEWLHLLHKHSWHHLRQFGINPSN